MPHDKTHINVIRYNTYAHMLSHFIRTLRVIYKFYTFKRKSGFQLAQIVKFFMVE